MDWHVKLALESDIAVAVLGRGDDIVLIRLDRANTSDYEAAADARRRGLEPCGMYRWKDMQTYCEMSDRPEAKQPMILAAVEFGRIVADSLSPADRAALKSLASAHHSLPGGFDA